MTKGYCRNCFTEFDMDEKRPIQECPNCNNKISFMQCKDDYFFYVQGNNGDSDPKYIVEYESRINQDNDRLVELEREVKRLQQKKEEDELRLERLKAYSEHIGINIYEAATRDLVSISAKIPRYMYNIVDKDIISYFKGSITTYIQSLIANDIAKNHNFYKQYAIKHPKVGKAKRDDAYIREDLAKRTLKAFPQDDESAVDEELMIRTFNGSVMNRRYSFTINDMPVDDTNADEIFKDICDKVKNWDYSEEVNENATRGPVTSDGVVAVLIQKDEDKERKIIRYVYPYEMYEKIRRLRRTKLVDNLYELFIKYNNSCAIVRV